MVQIMELAGKDFKTTTTSMFNRIEEKMNSIDLKTSLSSQRIGLSETNPIDVLCISQDYPEKQN